MSKLEVPKSTLHSILNWFRLAKPEKTKRNFQIQLGVHLEEVAEMIDTLETDNQDVMRDIGLAHMALEGLAHRLKTDPNCGVWVDGFELRHDFLDSLCDQIVTATGCAHFANLQLPEALDEVDLSNYSKFVNDKPVFDEHGKIAKGPHYFKPELSQFVLAEPTG